MANASNLKRHQQFGLIILMIVVIVGIAFTAWYFNEKKGTDDSQKNSMPVASERDSYNPADVTAGD